MEKKIWFLLIVALLLVTTLVSGCGANHDVPVGAGDNGGAFILKEGQVLVITLDANPSTGYGWDVFEIDENIIRMDGEKSFTPNEQLRPARVGAGGQETLRFVPVGKGETVLRLVYHRPWEKDVEPAEKFQVTVNVQ